MRPPPPLDAGLHPKERVAQACAVHGERAVVLWCADLIAERSPGREALPIQWLGNGDWSAYWFRVWGARALLYVWDDAVVPDVLAGLSDPHWRVREMAAKVVRARRIPAAVELARLLDDPVERVRTAALRALAVVGDVDQVAAVEAARADGSLEVRKAAERAAYRLLERPDS